MSSTEARDTGGDALTASSSTSERLTYALRQAALMAASLLVAGAVTERLRPDGVLDRGIIDTPFQWAVIVWFAVLVFHAVAFERSHMRDLERVPLLAALALGGIMLAIGLVALDRGSFGQRVVFLVANSVGAVLFWWGLFGLVALVVRRLAETT